MQRQQSSGSRPRPPRSCHNCSRRKVACDKTKPRCGRCARAGLDCVYAPVAAPGGSITFINETPAVATHQQYLSSRLNRLGRIISASQAESLDARYEPVGAEAYTQGSLYDVSAASTIFAPEDSFYASEDPALPISAFEDPGHLFVGTQSKGRYVSPAYFAMISQEVSEINELLRGQQRYSLHPITTSDDSTSDDELEPPSLPLQPRGDLEDMRLYGDIFPHAPAYSSRDLIVGQYSRSAKIEEIIEGIPSQPQCITLIRAYLAGYHTVSPMFHSPAFWNDVKLFFQKKQDPSYDYNITFHFLALFTAVLFAGSVVCPRFSIRNAFGDVSREELSTRLYKRSVKAIRMSDFPRSPSMQSLAAFIIANATWLRAEQPLTCCPFVAVAVRVAQMLGLHKEPSKFPDIDPIDVHVRRQLWWIIVSFDAQIALASGLPCIIETCFYDVAPVSELSETSIAIVPTEGASTIKDMLRTFVGGRLEFYRLSGRFLRILHGNTITEKDLDELMEITRAIQGDLYSRRERIALIMTAASNHGRAPEGAPVLSKFSKMVMSMLAAKPYSVMYGPLRRHGLLGKLQEKEPTHLMYCREYLHRFLRMAQCHHFQPWHWCWPGQHQPLYSIMALIQELEDRPYDPLAGETRRLIDLAIDMCGPSSNSGIIATEDGEPIVRPLNEGGTEAWTFIRRARERAWDKAGLDPSILNCPKSAKEIRFNGFPGQFDDIALPDDDVHKDNWLGPFPQLGEDWMSFFADLPAEWNM